MARRKKPSGRRSGFGDTRSLRDLRRTSRKKVPRRIITIVCEGKETEPNYFEALRRKYRLPTLNIKIVKEQGAPISIVNEAKQQKKNLDGKRDEVWCVFDVEAKGQSSTIDDAVSQAKAARLELGISNPTFEYWYLLHFDSTDRPFRNADAVIQELRKHIPDYEKNAAVFALLDDRTSIAIANAEQLRTNACDPWDKFPNPSTGVDRLVRQIQQLASS